MRRVVFAGTLAICLAGIFAIDLMAQAVDPALRKAVDGRTEARRSGDADAYARYVTEDAVISNSSGTVETRADRMKAIRGVKNTAPPPRVSDEKFRTFGTTVIRTWREDGLDSAGKKTAQRWTEVWVTQNGQWKAALIQFTNIAAP